MIANRIKHGIVGGLMGGVVFGMMMAFMGTLPMIGKMVLRTGNLRPRGFRVYSLPGRFSGYFSPFPVFIATSNSAPF